MPGGTVSKRRRSGQRTGASEIDFALVHVFPK